MDRGAWLPTVRGVTKSQIQLSNQHTHRLFLSHGSIALAPCCLPHPVMEGEREHGGGRPTLLKDPGETEMPLEQTWSHDHTQMQGRLGNVVQLCAWLQSYFFFPIKFFKLVIFN